MITHDAEQGTPEWAALRLAIPTASCFDKIITPSGKPSTSAQTYMHMLLAEWLMGEPADTYTNAAMDRGSEMEPEARAFYELERDAEVRQVGFVTRDDGLCGCSPDGLVGDDGGVELKCPLPGTQIGYLLEGKIPAKYVPQVQGNIYLCEREWWDFVSYHPTLPPVVLRVHRDKKFIAALTVELDKFIEAMLAKRQRLTEMGYKDAA